jgi:2-oxoglutarate dehydrogenase E1 component
VKRPLVVLTPKSLLRLSAAAGTARELEAGRFRAVLPDPSPPPASARVVLCQGKLFYELAERRAEVAADDLRLIRLERCTPFPGDEVRAELEATDGARVVWAQEEPENMGAGRFVLRNLRERLGVEAEMVSRPESPSPATGSLAQHRLEQAELIDRALGRPAQRRLRSTG